MEQMNVKLVKLILLTPSTKRYQFAFVGQQGHGALLVALGPIPIGAIHAAVKKVGIKTTYRGYCFGEASKLIFEVNRQPAQWLAKAIQDEIRTGGGHAVKVVCRQSDAPEEPGDVD